MTVIVLALCRKLQYDMPARTFHFALSMIFASLSTCCMGAEDAPPLRCGSHCLYTVMKRFDVGPQSFEDLDRELGQPTSAGYSMQQLSDFASGVGLQVQGVNTTLENLRARKGIFACITRVNKNHFVLLVDIGDSEVRLIDPPRSMSIPASTFQARWDGNALLISSVQLEPESDIVLRLWWQRFVYRTAQTVTIVFMAALGYWGWRRLRGC